MKKALIIANMMFASATVWGMDHLDIQEKEISVISRFENISQLNSRKNEFKELVSYAKSGLKNNTHISNAAKWIFAGLDGDDVWDQIKLDKLRQMLPQSCWKEDSLEIEKRAKAKAKRFFDEVLGNTILGRDLYKKAEEAIDSAKCDRCSNEMSEARVSEEYVRCSYYEEDQLVRTLVHETAHILDYFYRIRTKYGQSEALAIFKDKSRFYRLQKNIFPGAQMEEHVSIFFESLLGIKYFRKTLVPNYSQKFRIKEIFLYLFGCSFKHELAFSYEQSQLDDLISELRVDDIKKNISELRKNDKIRMYIDGFLKFNSILCPAELSVDEENLWQKLFQNLKKDGHEELLQFCRGVEDGKNDLYSYGSSNQEVFTFLRDSKEKKIILPELDGITWGQICGDILDKKEPLWSNLIQWLNDNGYTKLSKLLRDTGDGSIQLIDYEQNEIIKSVNYYEGLSKKTIELPQIEGLDWRRIFEIANKKNVYLRIGLSINNNIKYAKRLKSEKIMIALDPHIMGTLTAFNMINFYEQRFLDGNPVSTEELMAELIKPSESVFVTEDFVENLFKFLKR